MSSCVSYVLRTDDVSDEVSKSQRRSNSKIVIFQQERRPKSLWKCSWLSCWHIQFLVLLPVKKLVSTSECRPFKKNWNIICSFNLTSDMRYGDDVIDDVTGLPQSRPAIYIPSEMKWEHFNDNWKTNKDISMKFPYMHTLLNCVEVSISIYIQLER